MKIKEITDFLEQIAPLNYQENYDNSGLIVGDKNKEITKVLITLDCTEAVLQEAIETGCELIIAHHPIVFSGLKKFNGTDYVQRVVMQAIKKDIAIYAIHTNLDNVANGVNAMMAAKIGLKNTQILAPQKGTLKKLITFIPVENVTEVSEKLYEAGAGKIGNYSQTSFATKGLGTFLGNEQSNPTLGEQGIKETVNEYRFETIFPSYLQNKIIATLLDTHPYEEVAYDILTLDNAQKEVGAGLIGELETPQVEMEFLHFLKKTFHADGIRYTNLLQKKIQKVALCGGAGSFLLNHAIHQQADIFISADFKYHQFFDAENKLIIADIGHFETEQFTKELLFGFLSEKLPTFAFSLSKLGTNPINYL